SSPADSEMEDAEPDQRLVGAEVVYPPEDVAWRLGLRPSQQALVRRCVLLVGGEAVLVGDRYFPLDVAEIRQPERSIEELTLRMPSPEEARQLGISEGVPVVRVLRTLYDPAERPLEVSDFLLAGDRHVLVYEIPAH
ncbi:MAG: UTRA domain-containing protein, partial [Egibacteraceae bacterium]